MNQELTPLEKEVLALTARENWPDFRIEGVRVIRRENTGAGRFTYLEDEHDQQLTDGFYSAQGRLIEVPGVRNGLGFEIAVAASRISYIEFVTYGNVTWDGSEDGWRIV